MFVGVIANNPILITSWKWEQLHMTIQLLATIIMPLACRILILFIFSNLQLYNTSVKSNNTNIKTGKLDNPSCTTS